MAEELITLAGDLVAERKKLSDALHRLEGKILRGEPARTLSKVLGFEGLENLQFEIDSLAKAIDRLGSLTTTLIHTVVHDQLVTAEELLGALMGTIERTAERLGRSITLNAKGAETLLAAPTVDRFRPTLCKMAETLVEFSIEAERERVLRGKKEKARFQIEIKEMDDYHRLMLVCDGNGIMPPLADPQGVELAKVGARANFDGSPGKWSAWCFFLPKEGGPQRCIQVRSGGRKFCIPAWAVVDMRKFDEGRLPPASGQGSEPALRKHWRLSSDLTLMETSQRETSENESIFVDVGAGIEITTFVFDDATEAGEVFLRPLDERLSAGGRFSGVVVTENELVLVLNPAYLVYGDSGGGDGK